MSPSHVRQIVIGVCAFYCCVAQARATESLAQTIIGDFTGTKGSVVDVAAQLSGSKIPIGVEAVNGPEGPPINFDLKNATVADVLNAAVRADPRYRWTESDGVINLLPKNDANSVFDITVEHFEAINEMPAQIINQLVRTRKVKKYLDDRDVQAGTLTAGSFLSTPGAPAAVVRNSVVVDNETLRQALNEVLIKTGRFTGVDSMISRMARNISISTSGEGSRPAG
jgi:hypothetical protein